MSLTESDILPPGERDPEPRSLAAALVLGGLAVLVSILLVIGLSDSQLRSEDARKAPGAGSEVERAKQQQLERLTTPYQTKDGKTTKPIEDAMRLIVRESR